MKLAPVFLVAPKPPTGSVPTRRAFLFAGAAFLGGAVLGTACGYSLGAAANTPSAPAEPPEPPSTGNRELDELRRLAIKAPIDELVGQQKMFLLMVTQTYRRDHVLWQGVARLAEELLTNASIPERRLVAHWLAQVIEQGDADFTASLRSRAPELRKVR